MTPARREQLHALAVLIVEDQRRRGGQNSKKSPYMMNIGHPALNGVYLAWRMKAATHGVAPGDVERTAWELSLLSDEALEAIKRQYKEAQT